MTIALRVGRSRSIWEDGSVDEIARKEFPNSTGGVDLRPSVYVVAPADRVRAVAEHLAQLSPPVANGVVELDLSDLATTQAASAQRHFSFTNETHAELVLPNTDALLALVAAVKSTPARRLPRDRDEIMAFVSDREAQQDGEWLALLEAKPKWREILTKWRTRRA